MKNINKHLYKVFIHVVLISFKAGNPEQPISSFKRSLEPITHSDDERTGIHDNKHKLGNDGMQNEFENDDTIMAILEEKYKFINDEMSTRFKIAGAAGEYTVVPKTQDERNIDWAFRSFTERHIVGGLETNISMYPYNVAIARNEQHWCGGAIIDEQWVLTAGHCVDSAFGNERELQPLIVRAGSSYHNRGGYRARINKIFFPQGYLPDKLDYDFALLRLDRPLPIGRTIAVLNLPSRAYIIKEDDLLTVTGWGSTNDGHSLKTMGYLNHTSNIASLNPFFDEENILRVCKMGFKKTGFRLTSDRLRFVPVPVMNHDDCQKPYKFYITPTMICAGYATGGKDACSHDSGGPAVYDGVLIGIVSFGGKRCGDPGSPAVYSRVAEITEWVVYTISHNEANTIPELLPNIQKAREREKELQKFEAHVEGKKNKMKNWLQKTLNTPSFIELVKKNLRAAGYHTRRSLNNDAPTNSSNVDDNTMDEINLTNLINDRIIDHGDGSELDKLLRTVALRDVMLNDPSSEKTLPNIRAHGESASVESFIAYISGM